MTTIQVREHTRKKPDRIKKLKFSELIEARIAARKASAERLAASRPVSYPRVFRAIAEALRAWRG